MTDFEIGDLIDKMADCEFLYFTFIFRIIFGVLALILIGFIVIILPLSITIFLFLYMDARCGWGSVVINLVILLLEIFYFDFIKNCFIKTAGFFFVLSC
jgi:hypothetical protein